MLILTTNTGDATKLTQLGLSGVQDLIRHASLIVHGVAPGSVAPGSVAPQPN